MSEPLMDTPPTHPSGDMFVVDSPYEVARWRPLVHWVMYIPHAIILRFFQALGGVAFLFNWVIVLFKGRLNHSLYEVQTGAERYNARSSSFLVGYTEQWAPFDFALGPMDDGRYDPVRLDLPRAPETTPKSALFNFLLAIPHYFVLVLIGIGALFVAIFAWFAVLFTGRWPQGGRDFLVRFSNYYYRVWVYVTMVRTEYPKFGLH